MPPVRAVMMDVCWMRMRSHVAPSAHADRFSVLPTRAASFDSSSGFLRRHALERACDGARLGHRRPAKKLVPAIEPYGRVTELFNPWPRRTRSYRLSASSVGFLPTTAEIHRHGGRDGAGRNLQDQQQLSALAIGGSSSPWHARPASRGPARTVRRGRTAVFLGDMKPLPRYAAAAPLSTARFRFGGVFGRQSTSFATRVGFLSTRPEREGCLAVSFQEVVHSVQSMNADVTKPQ